MQEYTFELADGSELKLECTPKFMDAARARAGLQPDEPVPAERVEELFAELIKLAAEE